MASAPVIVFGPTGAVGGAAAIEAHRRSKTVNLAMRDTKRDLKGIQESGNEESYIRIHADLSKPETVKHAVKTSSATTAFVYAVFNSTDNMRSTFAAMKEAGITYVVFLSSFTVHDPASSETNMKDMIPAVHAKTEVALQESGISYTAVRPAYFTSNVLWALEDIKKGEVEVVYPNVKFDYLAPEDIGTVCGALLAEPEFQKSAGPSIYLCGPELLTQRDGQGVIAKALGKDIKVKEIGEERFLKKMGHMPKPVADSMLGGLRDSDAGIDPYAENYDQAVKNLRMYLEREPMRLGEWVQAHKKEFE